ncbi:MAG TPA: helix-turn-helix domain-containing protein [Pseudonocardiaceae bacterium]|nr:helix-turn-helix domain-containing protein [Pseudonocardiaceae bacterium]
MTADFWDQQAMRNALKTREFGEILAAYRKAHDGRITQADMGRWLRLTQGQVSRIERRATLVRDLAKLERWAQVLRIPQRCLWFPLPPQASDTCLALPPTSSLPSARRTEGGDVRRRQFLKTAGAGMTMAGTSLLATDPTRPTPAKPDVAPHNPDVELIRQMTAVFRRLDNRYGGGHSRSDVGSFLTSSVETKLRHVRGREASRRDLFTAAAELYQLAGWMDYDTGHPVAGRTHFRHALRLSQEAGDDALSAEMFAGMSHHAAFHGAPGDAVDLALAARQLANRSGLAQLKAEAAVMEAHGLALQEDSTGCLARLHDAEEAFAAADRGDTPTWLGYFDSAYLAAKFAHVFRDLGRPQEAELFARRSLEMSDGYERGKLFNTALLASTLADQRRVEEACSVGMRAVGMAGSLRSVRSAAYLADVGRRLAPFHTNADVRSLYEQMADTGIPAPIL